MQKKHLHLSCLCFASFILFNSANGSELIKLRLYENKCKVSLVDIPSLNEKELLDMKSCDSALPIQQLTKLITTTESGNNFQDLFKKNDIVYCGNKDINCGHPAIKRSILRKLFMPQKIIDVVGIYTTPYKNKIVFQTNYMDNVTSFLTPSFFCQKKFKNCKRILENSEDQKVALTTNDQYILISAKNESQVIDMKTGEIIYDPEDAYSLSWLNLNP